MKYKQQLTYKQQFTFSRVSFSICPKRKEEKPHESSAIISVTRHGFVEGTESPFVNDCDFCDQPMPDGGKWIVQMKVRKRPAKEGGK